MDAKKVIRQFFSRIILLLLGVTGIVILLDPFYQYHKPLGSMKAVLTDRDNQCIGSVLNFDYDALILGSSVTENFNNHWFDEGYHCTTIKAIRASGSTADLQYLLNQAYKDHDLKYVFYGLDTMALISDVSASFDNTNSIMYLYTRNIFDDYPYLWNKEVLLEKIPYMLAYSYLFDYDDGKSYNWAIYKNFSAQDAMRAYSLAERQLPMLPENYFEDLALANLSLVQENIEAHPETEFIIFFPPYSLLWWDSAYCNGFTDSYLYIQSRVIETLLTYDNVELYYFQQDREVVSNLDNYMDMVHYSEQINYRMYQSMVSQSNMLTIDNYKDVLEDMCLFVKEISNELIYNYYGSK